MVSKYYEMSSRGGRKVSVFALNYGLCEKYAIEFGRPSGKREYRLYLVERVFDYSSILQEFLRANQEIVCDSCGERFAAEQLEALKMYNMRCPKCGDGTCRVNRLSRKYEPVLKAVESDLLLNRTELGILQTLESENRPMFAGEIAAELDCSYQLVGKRGKMLAERGLVSRREGDQGRRVFEITKKAEHQYFGDGDHPDLDIADG